MKSIHHLKSCSPTHLVSAQSPARPQPPRAPAAQPGGLEGQLGTAGEKQHWGRRAFVPNTGDASPDPPPTLGCNNRLQQPCRTLAQLHRVCPSQLLAGTEQHTPAKSPPRPPSQRTCCPDLSHMLVTRASPRPPLSASACREEHHAASPHQPRCWCQEWHQGLYAPDVPAASHAADMGLLCAQD